MGSVKKSAMAAVLLLVAMTAVAFGQGPVQKRVNYTINVSHELRMGDYMLPPGMYVIYQISQNDINLFGLYQYDLAREPIAMIRTVRIDYSGNEYPGKTSMILELDEASVDLHPVLRGWNIPGMDGFEIISVVAKDTGILTRVR